MGIGTGPTAVRASHPKILVVDDSDAMRRALRRVLEQHFDWEVCGEAANGREALEKAEQCGPDVILLDFQMPEMNGLEAAREMRRRSPEIPILMVTMHMSPQLAVEAREAGIRGTCSKTEAGCLTEAVQTLLQHGTYYRN
jgi:DNA-binding NarL/FixJ family response regulator